MRGSQLLFLTDKNWSFLILNNYSCSLICFILFVFNSAMCHTYTTHSLLSVLYIHLTHLWMLHVLLLILSRSFLLLFLVPVLILNYLLTNTRFSIRCLLWIFVLNICKHENIGKQVKLIWWEDFCKGRFLIWSPFFICISVMLTL